MAENNHASTHLNDDYYEVSDFFEWVENVLEYPAASSVDDHSAAGHDDDNIIHPTHHHSAGCRDRSNISGKKEKREKFAFKTKSQVEVLDDGFKWRKYGKKMVKNSPNPRNYYRCSVEGCPVKKQVERDKEDPQYVLTTYEGVHIHH